LVEDYVGSIMSEKKITPEVVKKIEGALEERKTRRDRRDKPASSDSPAGADRRAGRDRRSDK
jgi:hypothetical protein